MRRSGKCESNGRACAEENVRLAGGRLGSDALESDAKFSDAVRSDAADGDRSRWTVDVHSHVYLPRYIQMLRDRGSVPRIQAIGGQDRLLILPDEDKSTSTVARARACRLTPCILPLLPAHLLRSQRPADWRRVLEPRSEARVHGHPPHRRVGALDGKPVARLCRRPARGGRAQRRAQRRMRAACAASAGRLYGFGVLPLGVADGAGDACGGAEAAGGDAPMRGVIIGTRALDDPARTRCGAPPRRRAHRLRPPALRAGLRRRDGHRLRPQHAARARLPLRHVGGDRAPRALRRPRPLPEAQDPRRALGRHAAVPRRAASTRA